MQQPPRVEQADPMKRHIAPEGLRWLKDAKAQCLFVAITTPFICAFALTLYACQS